MQDSLFAGDALVFTDELPDYPASSGYVVKYVLAPRTSGTVITLTSIAAGDDHLIRYLPPETAAWTAGEYSWFRWVEGVDERVTLDSGTCTIRPNPATMTVYDGRSQAEVALAAAQDALATYSSSGGRVKRYAIAGREMEFSTSADLVKEVSYWQSVVNREQAAAAVRAGQADPRRVYIRMGRA